MVDLKSERERLDLCAYLVLAAAVMREGLPRDIDSARDITHRVWQTARIMELDRFHAQDSDDDGRF